VRRQVSGIWRKAEEDGRQVEVKAEAEVEVQFKTKDKRQKIKVICYKPVNLEEVALL
jgi:hypothetical protein